MTFDVQIDRQALLEYLALGPYERALRTAAAKRDLRAVMFSPASNLFDRGTAGLWLWQVESGVRRYG